MYDVNIISISSTAYITILGWWSGNKLCNIHILDFQLDCFSFFPRSAGKSSISDKVDIDLYVI